LILRWDLSIDIVIVVRWEPLSNGIHDALKR
jgi:hypothetical protein